jgi:hypothetical protein
LYDSIIWIWFPNSQWDLWSTDWTCIERNHKKHSISNESKNGTTILMELQLYIYIYMLMWYFLAIIQYKQSLDNGTAAGMSTRRFSAQVFYIFTSWRHQNKSCYKLVDHLVGMIYMLHKTFHQEVVAVFVPCIDLDSVAKYTHLHGRLHIFTQTQFFHCEYHYIYIYIYLYIYICMYIFIIHRIWMWNI